MEHAKTRKGEKTRYQFHPYFLLIIVLPILITCYYLVELIEYLKTVFPQFFSTYWGLLLVATLLLLSPLFWRGYCAIESHRQSSKDRSTHRELLQAVTRQVQRGGTLEFEHQGTKVKLNYPSVVGVSPHIVTVREELQQPLLANKQLEPTAPTQQFLLGALPPNSMVVSPGIRRSTGEIVKVCVLDVPHFKIIGSSGFGKSCLAASLLDQATSLNSPDMLQIALLDLENKTSRLFQDRPHIAAFKLGQRTISMVATNVDEVIQQLGLLKSELNRRTKLSEEDIEKEPVLFTYIEEVLALQYELDDSKLLDQILSQLTILALRGRKYRMFLLCCTQTDYSSDGLRVAQKQFRFRAAGGIDLTAARAAGFLSSSLIKDNFQNAQPGEGLFVVEFPSFADIVIAPRFDWKMQLRAQKLSRNSDENDLKNWDETTLQAKQEAVQDLLFKGWGKVAIIEKVWQKKAGGTAGYKAACAEYEQIVETMSEE